MNADKCRSCGAPIVWAASKAGKAMPVDLECAPDGNILIDDGKAIVLTKEQLAFFVPKDTLRKSHFVTCPEAAKWRTRGKKR